MPTSEVRVTDTLALRLLRRIFRAALVNPHPTPALTAALNAYLTHLGHPLAPRDEETP